MKDGSLMKCTKSMLIFLQPLLVLYTKHIERWLRNTLQKWYCHLGSQYSTVAQFSLQSDEDDPATELISELFKSDSFGDSCHLSQI